MMELLEHPLSKSALTQSHIYFLRMTTQYLKQQLALDDVGGRGIGPVLGSAGGVTRFGPLAILFSVAASVLGYGFGKSTHQ